MVLRRRFLRSDPRRAATWALTLFALVGLVTGGVGLWSSSTPAALAGGSAPVSPSVAIADGPAPALAHTAAPSLAHRLATVSLAQGPNGYLFNTPAWLAYDHADQSFYVAVAPSSVDVVPGNFTWAPNVTATIPVGSAPFGVAVDDRTGDIFVTNSGSNNVSVLNPSGPNPIKSIPVGTDPLGVAYDPVDSEIYVANNGSDNVSVISDSTLTVVATIPVGANPTGVAVDPVSGRVYVANHGSANVSVIANGTTSVAATDPTLAGPYGVAVDNQTGLAYVTDEFAGNVTVVNATATVTNISIPGVGWSFNLQGVAYDWADGYIWVAAGENPLAVIDPATETVVTVLTFDPAGVAFDPDTGDVCVTNTANTTFECAQFLAPPPTYYLVSFNESGLPAGHPWNVTLAGNTQSSIYSGESLDYYVTNGTYSYVVGGAYGYAATPSSGQVTVDGADEFLNVSFSTVPEYPVTISEVGLPNGTFWEVDFGSEVGSFVSSGSSVVVDLTNGSYSFLPLANGYTPNGTYDVVVAGAPASVSVEFLHTGLVVEFLETGLAPGTLWQVYLGGVVNSSNTSEVTCYVSSGTYPYTLLATGYTSDDSPGTVVVGNSSVVVNVTFEYAPYVVTFAEQGLAAGATFNVTLNGVDHGGTGAVTFAEPNGTYNFSVASLPGEDATPGSGNLTVAGANLTITVVFAAPNSTYYDLTFEEAGLPNGTGWGVVIGSDVESSLSPNVTFLEPNGTYGYVVLAVSGYSTNYSGSVTVEGADSTVAITFAPTAYPVVFVEFGLPNGSRWSVTATETTSGVTRSASSVTDAVTLELPNGTYAVNFTLPSGYSASSVLGPVTVAGAAVAGGSITVAGPAGPSSGGFTLTDLLLVAFLAAVGATVVTALFVRRRRPPPDWQAPPSL